MDEEECVFVELFFIFGDIYYIILVKLSRK